MVMLKMTLFLLISVLSIVYKLHETVSSCQDHMIMCMPTSLDKNEPTLPFHLAMSILGNH